MKENKGKNTDFTGTWHIYEMELWDEDYFNMDVQAYIKIKPDSLGFFQFGLVCGQIDGRTVNYAEGTRFEFTWKEMMSATLSLVSAGSGEEKTMNSKASSGFILEIVQLF